MARWRAIAHIVIERLSEILHPKLLALLKGILSQALLRPALLRLRVRLRHHALAHVFVDVVDRAKNWARRRLLIDSPLVSLDQSQRLVALPLDARQRLTEVATEIIELRLQANDDLDINWVTFDGENDLRGKAGGEGEKGRKHWISVAEVTKSWSIH